MNCVSDIIQLDWAHSRRIMGQGIGVAVMDTGICGHMDFGEEKSRILAFQDFINHREIMYDDNGHGTHVSGIIGGNGNASRGRYVGVAPKCNIISLKVLNQKGNGNVLDVLQGLKWILENREKYNIRIVNISVGTAKKELVSEDSVLVKGVNEVWDKGIVVVVAAGNNGPMPKSIGAPGISRKVITVGASDDNVPIMLSGSSMRDYSGRGPTSSCIKKPDIVAPGSNIVSCNLLNDNVNRGLSRNFGLLGGNRKELFQNRYTIKSGTSMATPIVSGAIALLLGEYPQMSNREVKVRLKNSAEDMGLSHERQGWGRLNIERMLRG